MGTRLGAFPSSGAVGAAAVAAPDVCVIHLCMVGLSAMAASTLVVGVVVGAIAFLTLIPRGFVASVASAADADVLAIGARLRRTAASGSLVVLAVAVGSIWFSSPAARAVADTALSALAFSNTFIPRGFFTEQGTSAAAVCAVGGSCRPAAAAGAGAVGAAAAAAAAVAADADADGRAVDVAASFVPT